MRYIIAFSLGLAFLIFLQIKITRWFSNSEDDRFTITLAFIIIYYIYGQLMSHYIAYKLKKIK